MISAPTELRDKALTDWGILERPRECWDTNYAMLLQANQPNLGASAEQSNLWLSWVAKFSAQCCACLSLFKILFSKQRKVCYRKKSHIFPLKFSSTFLTYENSDLACDNLFIFFLRKQTTIPFLLIIQTNKTIKVFVWPAEPEGSFGLLCCPTSFY